MTAKRRTPVGGYLIRNRLAGAPCVQCGKAIALEAFIRYYPAFWKDGKRVPARVFCAEHSAERKAAVTEPVKAVKAESTKPVKAAKPVKSRKWAQ